MKTCLFKSVFIGLIVLLLLIFNSNIQAQITSNYPYFAPYWSYGGIGSTSLFPYYNYTGLPIYGGVNSFSSVIYPGIPDFGNFGFGTYGFPGTGAFGGYGSPVSMSAVRPFGSFGVTSMGPSWSTYLLGIPSWIMTGLSGPWFRTPLF